MKLEDSIAKSIFKYPGLYKDANWEKSRRKVLSHLFLTAGNGLDWHDGFLTSEFDYDPDTDKLKRVKLKKYGKEKFDWRPTQKWFDEPIYRDLFKDARQNKQLIKVFKAAIKEHPKFEGINLLKEENRHTWKPYPLSEFSEFDYPQNVRPDWLNGALEILTEALKFWNEPTPVLERDSHIKEIIEAKMIGPHVITRVANDQIKLIEKYLKKLHNL